MLNNLTKDDFFILIKHKENEFQNHCKMLYGSLVGNFIMTVSVSLIVFLSSWGESLPFYYTCAMIFSLVIQCILFIVWILCKNRLLFSYVVAITTALFPLHLSGLPISIIYWMKFSQTVQIMFLIIILGGLFLYFHSVSLIKKRLMKGVYRKSGAGLTEESFFEKKIGIISACFSAISIPLIFILRTYRRTGQKKVSVKLNNLFASIGLMLLAVFVTVTFPYRFHYLIINIYIEKRFKE